MMKDINFDHLSKEELLDLKEQLRNSENLTQDEFELAIALTSCNQKGLPKGMEGQLKEICCNHIQYREDITYAEIQEMVHYAPQKPSFSYELQKTKYASHSGKRPRGTILA